MLRRILDSEEGVAIEGDEILRIQSIGRRVDSTHMVLNKDLPQELERELTEELGLKFRSGTSTSKIYVSKDHLEEVPLSEERSVLIEEIPEKQEKDVYLRRKTSTDFIGEIKGDSLFFKMTPSEIKENEIARKLGYGYRIEKDGQYIWKRS